MKRIQIFAALLLFAWTLNAQTALDEAKKKIVNENYNEAKGLLDKYIASEKDPNKQAEAYFWLGECDYLNLIDDNPQQAMEKAREQYNKGLTLSKGNAQCQVGMGKLLLDKKNEKEALKTFDSAVRASKAKPYKEGHPEIFMLIGDAYMNGVNKNLDQADANYTRARDIEPKSATALIKMGDAKLAKGDAGGAMSAYETASQKDPKNPEVYLKRALIWQRASKYDKAIEECEAGRKVDESYAGFCKLLAELHYATGEFNKVTGDLDCYLSKTKIDDPDARLRFIKFLTYSAKDYTRAITEANKFAATSADKYPSVYRWLAWANFEKATLLEKGKKPAEFGDEWKMLMEESNKASKMLLAKLPADRVVDYDYNYAMRSSLKLNDIASAIKYGNEVIKLDSTRTCEIYSSFIQGYYDQKLIKEGLSMLDEKVNKGCKATYSDYFFGMYYANAVTREYERSIKYCDKYIEAVPSGPDGFYYKGMSQTQIDDVENPKWLAKDTYEKLIALYEAKPEDARTKSFVTTAYNYMAIYYGAQQDLVKAKEFCQKVLAIEPANKTALNTMTQLGN
ncbi:MAG: tetratricopeptide repeat protein [Saprospiraceae bacterium]|nr:tetratricopeptide repeat protein [Saprospiraceae bacterium]